MHAVKYVIPEIPPSNNKFIGRENRFEYQQYKKAWADKVRLLCRPKPKKPIEKSNVLLTYFFPDNRRRDPDNYSGKMIMDGLVRAGIIKDDSFDCVSLFLDGQYDKENPRTEIYIREIKGGVSVVLYDEGNTHNEQKTQMLIGST
jgi:Holliday junction resolvase RusA-like endonuclease